jgi:hypothetical protein
MRMCLRTSVLTTTQKNKMEPITGISSEGYKGVGQVQSPATGLEMEEPEEDEDDE